MWNVLHWVNTGVEHRQYEQIEGNNKHDIYLYEHHRCSMLCQCFGALLLPLHYTIHYYTTKQTNIAK